MCSLENYQASCQFDHLLSHTLPIAQQSKYLRQYLEKLKCAVQYKVHTNYHYFVLHA